MSRRALLRTSTALALFLVSSGAGYLLSSQLSGTALQREAEAQLGELLAGEVEADEVRLRLDGLRLEGRGVRVYRSADGPALKVDFASAGIDPLSLLMGRFRLRWLRLDGVRLRIDRTADGRWGPYPVAHLARGEQPSRHSDLEHRLGVANAFEEVTRFLLAKAEIADRVELFDGRVELVDRASTSESAPHIVLLTDLHGSLDHGWLGQRAELTLHGRLEQGAGAGARVEASGQKHSDGRLSIAIAASGLGLAAFEPYLEHPESATRLRGALSGVVAYETRETNHGELEIDWVVRDLSGALPIQAAELELEAPTARLRARFQIHPGKLRLASLEAGGGDVALRLEGVVERPLRESSNARLAARVSGVALPELRRIVGWLPDSDAEPLERLLERVESGHVTAVAARGTTRVGGWRQLFAGELPRLPRGFVLGAEIANFSVDAGDEDVLGDLEGAIEWSGDEIALRDVTGRWNGRQLPTLDLAVDGVSRLFASDEAHRELAGGARSLEGLGALWRWAERFRPESSAATDAPPPVRLEIAHLHHPVLRWPVLDARLDIEWLDEGTRVTASRGHWAGAPIVGQALWRPGPRPRLAVQIEVASPLAIELPPAVKTSAWARGRFEVGQRSDAPMPFEKILGRFAITGSTLKVSGVRAHLLPQGQLDSELDIDLARPDAVALDGVVELRDGDAGQLAAALGLPSSLATGTVDGRIDVRGDLRPEAEMLEGLYGTLTLRARNGEIRQDIPLAAALFAATEGVSPAQASKGLAFETIETRVVLEDGIAVSDRFELEGPVRVFAQGKLDLSGRNGEVDAVVGVYLLRQADRTLGRIPLLGGIVSDKGLIGAYFALRGRWAEPTVDPLPIRSLTEALPELVRAPFKALGRIYDFFELSGEEEDPAPPAHR